MDIYAYPPLISSLLFAVLGIFVLTNNRSSKNNYLFSLSCFTTFIWQFAWVFLFSAKSPALALVLIKIGYSGIIFIPITLFHFYTNYLNSWQEKRLIPAYYLLGLFFLICLWSTNQFINNYYQYFWGYYPRANILHLVYLLLCLTLAIRAIVLLKNSLDRELSSSRKNQIRYMLIALFIYCFAAFDFLGNWGLGIYPFGFSAILLSLAITSYAIFRHHLLDIKIVIKRTAVYSILTALLTGIFLSFIILGEHFFRGAIGYSSIWVAMFAAFFVSLIFQPLKNSLQDKIDHIFFKEKYDYQTTLKELSINAAATIELDRLLDQFSDKISHALKPDNISFYLIDNKTPSFRLKKKTESDKNVRYN